MILAGDLGGTNTRLGLFRPTAPRPEAIVRRDYRTLDYPATWAIVARFLREAGVEPRAVTAACIGVAGPVRNRTAVMTNVPWPVSAAELEEHLQLPAVRLLNDVVAMAHGIPALRPDDLVVLQRGRPDPAGAVALVTLGTGYGTCVLHRAGTRRLAAPAECGHSDFTVRTDRDLDAWRRLRARFGRVDIERIVSGIGLGNLFDVMHEGPCPAAPAALDPQHRPATLIGNAREGRCAVCREAFDLFLEALSAAMGNFALQSLSTGGLYLGGGIAPRIVGELRAPGFLDAFRAKAPMDDVAAEIPVAVVLDPDLGLIGAALAGFPQA